VGGFVLVGLTWYGTGVLDCTANLTAPQWQLPFSSTGIAEVVVVGQVGAKSTGLGIIRGNDVC